MIKLLFFINTTLSSGGAEKVLRTLVNNMDQSRFDITVITSWPEDGGKYLAPGIHYRSLYPARNQFWRLVSRLEAGLGLTYRMRMAGEYDIEIAYLEHGPTKVLASSTNQRARKLAWVHCELDKTETDIAQLQKKASPWYPKFDRVICVSRNVRDSFYRLFGDSHRCEILYNVVDSEDICTKAAQPLPDALQKRKRTVATIGRMYPQKGYDRLLQAHRRLHEDGLDYDLWILGDGPDRSALEDYCRENHLEDSVFMPGFLTNPYPAFREADVIVCSSRYEGFSTVITEALILGKPVVTTDCSGMDELLGNNEFGIVTENSEDGLYAGLKKMLTEPGLMDHYAAAAAQRGRDFHRGALVGRHEAFFTELLEGTSKQ